MGETAFFVQFPHPGGEHVPRTNDMPWNADDHRRKFLVAPGQYLDRSGRRREAKLAFWGEWEPSSRVRKLPRNPDLPHDRHLPRALHCPYWGEPATDRFRQNTDPWVFGEQMMYSNCRQLSRPPRRIRTARRRPRRPNSMQELTPGSVICFGSTIDGKFCVDTVLVVASAECWVPAQVADLKVDDAFKTCTGDSIATRRGNARLPLTLYRGATFDDRTDHGMFSFVPAKRANVDDPGFPRPSVNSKLVKSQSSRNFRRLELPVNKVREAWEELRAGVLKSGCLLAVRLETPKFEKTSVAVGRATDGYC